MRTVTYDSVAVCDHLPSWMKDIRTKLEKMKAELKALEEKARGRSYFTKACPPAHSAGITIQCCARACVRMCVYGIVDGGGDPSPDPYFSGFP